MTAPQLNDTLSQIFSKENGWEHGPMFYCGDKEQASYMSKKIAGTTYVVSATSHDLSEDTSSEATMAGGRSVVQTLKDITTNYPEGETKVLIPIAQANNYGPCGKFGSRGHLVLLEVNINNGALTNATLHDSKGGMLDHLYSGADRLHRMLNNGTLPNTSGFSVDVEHRGEQSLLNGKDCGRFTTYYAHEITEHGNLEQASKAGARIFFNSNFG
ncbi:hypothetical protein ACET8U_22595 [Aeromonas veronii]